MYPSESLIAEARHLVTSFDSLPHFSKEVKIVEVGKLGFSTVTYQKEISFKGRTAKLSINKVGPLQ